MFSVGAMANGIKYRTLGALLLIFYNQVMGLSPAVAASAIFIVTICDAIFDPVVGYMSDNLRSRYGRRHPFMYLSAFPLGLSLFLLFNPPAFITGGGLFFYLLFCLLTLRFFDTFYDIPAAALVPELTSDYDERTTIIALRQAMSLSAGLVIIMAAYQIFMKENPDGTGGITSRDGYLPYTVLAGSVMAISILISSLSTHYIIPWLSKPERRQSSVRQMAREIVSTLNHRSFLTLAGAILILSVGTGLRGSLETYFYLYFWDLSQAQIATLSAISLPGSLLAAVVAPAVARRIGKKHATMSAFLLAAVVSLVPVALRVAGVLPENGNALVFAIIAIETFVSQILLVGAVVLSLSMLTDVVEEVEVKTGRRSEGLLLCGEAMMKKITSGVGVFLSGWLLTHIHFPDNAKAVGVGADVLYNMGVLYIPIFAGVLGAGVTVLSFFNIDRRRHLENLEVLRDAAAAKNAVDAAGAEDGEEAKVA